MGRAASLVPQADYVWRIILMFGTVPAALTYYWRMKMPETARYTALIARNAKQAAADMSRCCTPRLRRARTAPRRGRRRESWGLFSRRSAPPASPPRPTARVLSTSLLSRTVPKTLSKPGIPRET
uniref:Inorganic phosphate transporter n=1 Tax=Oryza sativa subsp. indica TaxID=39946 RepID=D0AB63_ORYSI|nr:inorganic phosphate transporter [Oryza sativa Indica Group]